MSEFNKVNRGSYEFFFAHVNQVLTALRSGKYRQTFNGIIDIPDMTILPEYKNNDKVLGELQEKGGGVIDLDEVGYNCCAQGAALIEMGFTQLRVSRNGTMYLENPDLLEKYGEHKYFSDGMPATINNGVYTAFCPPVLISDVVEQIKDRYESMTELEQKLSGLISEVGLSSEYHAETLITYNMIGLNDILKLSFKDIADIIEKSWPKVRQYCEESNWDVKFQVNPGF